ncbi:MAG TPA: hypothetical protein VK797_02665 [Tepidisphaeraceae bacterium]|nr:hypothetical protein [Tepidisphaeraceae bacterium]
MRQFNTQSEGSRVAIEPDVNQAGSIFGALIEVYRKHGFEQGYQKAMNDVLGSLVHLTEQYLGARTDDAKADVRRIVYGYVEHLQSEIRRASSDAGYVSGGLGI